MLKPGADVLIRATVMRDGRLLVSPGAVIEPAGADILGDVEHGMALGERAMLIMYFRCEQERQRFADGLDCAGGDRRCADRTESSLDESDDGPHFSS